MTFALGAGVLGIVLMYAGIRNVTLAQAFRGDTKPRKGSAAAYNEMNLNLDPGIPASDTPTPTETGNLPAGVSTFDGKPVANWIIPILKHARKHGWKGSVNSGYRSPADQARVCATGVKPCAKPGTSRHQGKRFPNGAVDVSDAAGLNRAKRTHPMGNLLVWAGAKDPPHFSHPVGGSY